MLGKHAADSTYTSGASLGNDCRSLVASLAKLPAERYLCELLSPGLGGTRGTWNTSEITNHLDDPALCLRTMYSRYAFSRRGKERKALAELAGAALESA